jgi:ABC-2 type transport system ATP-binding protein
VTNPSNHPDPELSAPRENASNPSTREPSGRRGAGARVEARNLGRRFGEHAAVVDMNLAIEAGECFGLLGANGAGKTTFIRMLTGFLVPSSGEITVDGISPARHPLQVQARLGYVPEMPRLYSEWRVKNFLGFVAGLHGLSGHEGKRAVARGIERFGLQEVAKRLIGHLSRGYCQRVSLAQAFLHRPSLVVVDEPTVGLDPRQREEVQERLAELKGECTILLCTHDLDEALRLTSRAAILRRGALLAVGQSAELLAGDAALRFFGDAAADSPEGGLP